MTSYLALSSKDVFGVPRVILKTQFDVVIKVIKTGKINFFKKTLHFFFFVSLDKNGYAFQFLSRKISFLPSSLMNLPAQVLITQRKKIQFSSKLKLTSSLHCSLYTSYVYNATQTVECTEMYCLLTSR